MSRSSAAQLGFAFEQGEPTAESATVGPTPVAAGPSKGEQIKARIAANREKRLGIAEAMKQEAGVTEHELNENREDLSGLAWFATGKIRSPEGENIWQLYTLAHECGHIFLHSGSVGIRLQPHVKEMEAESYAQQAMREYGMRVPRWLTDGGRRYVGSWIEKDRSNGIAIDPRAIAYANGTRSPYEPLRMLPTTWTLHAAIAVPSQRINSLRRSIERWMRPQPGSLRWTLFDIWDYVRRGLAIGMFLTLIGLQLRLIPRDAGPFELTAANLFVLATGGLVGACMMLLRRPVVPRRKSAASRIQMPR